MNDRNRPGEGTKHDQGKPRVELLPFRAMEYVARVQTGGAVKYGDHNWRGGMKWSRLLGALLRHVFAWARGEDTDPEWGLPHLAHAACCVLFLLEYQLDGLGEDDRYRPNDDRALDRTADLGQPVKQAAAVKPGPVRGVGLMETACDCSCDYGDGEPIENYNAAKGPLRRKSVKCGECGDTIKRGAHCERVTGNPSRTRT